MIFATNIQHCCHISDCSKSFLREIVLVFALDMQQSGHVLVRWRRWFLHLMMIFTTIMQHCCHISDCSKGFSKEIVLVFALDLPQSGHVLVWWRRWFLHYVMIFTTNIQHCCHISDCSKGFLREIVLVFAQDMQHNCHVLVWLRRWFMCFLLMLSHLNHICDVLKAPMLDALVFTMVSSSTYVLEYAPKVGGGMWGMWGHVRGMWDGIF